MNERERAALHELTSAAAALPSLSSAEEIDQATAALLHRVIGCDLILHTTVDLHGSGTVVHAGEHLVRDQPMSAALAGVAHRHPAILSYLRQGDDRRPRRVSDLVPQREWLDSAVYNEVFRSHRARHQLSLVTTLSSRRGSGWVLTRASRDFTDTEVATAELLLPYTTTLAHVSELKSSRRPPPAATPAAARLTDRESAVLSALGTGASAAAIARQLRISERTVRKHLEHIYAKLAVHDRLSAVIRAAQLG